MKWIFVIIVLLLMPCLARSFDVPFRKRSANAGLPGEWLNAMAISARQAGMGHLVTGLGESASATINPSELVGLPAGDIQFMVAPLFSGGSYQSISMAYPRTPQDGYALSFLQLESGTAEKTDDLGQNVGSFEDKNFALTLSGGWALHRFLNSGLNLKMIRQNLSGKIATGIGSDMGFNIKPFRDKVFIGITYQNILPPKLKIESKSETFPRTVRSGLAYKDSIAQIPYVLGVDGQWNLEEGDSEPIRWGSGIEFNFYQQRNWPLSVRTGITHREFTFGLGVGRGPVRLDYATSFHELEILHRFGFTLKYGMLPPYSENRIKSEWEKLEEKENLLTKKEKAIDKQMEAHEKNVQRTLDQKINFDEAKKEYRQKNYEKTIDILKELKPKEEQKQAVTILASMSWAHLYIDEGMYADAKEKLIRVVEMEPDHEEATLMYKRLLTVIEMEESLK